MSKIYNVTEAIVCGVWQREDGAYFMLHQANTNSFLFPGGKVEAGESRETALQRERREELGVAIKINRYLGADRPTIQQNVTNVRLHFFAISCEEVPHIQEPGNHTKAVWVAIEDAANELGFCCKIHGIITENKQDIKTAFRNIRQLKTQLPKIVLNFRSYNIRKALCEERKTIETRALNPEEPARYFGDIQRDDRIQMNYLQTDGEEERIIFCRVKKAYQWRSLSELGKMGITFLQKILPDENRSHESPGSFNLEKYRSFSPGYVAKCNQNGMVGWEIEKIQ